jgi:hypothetical protein
MKVQRSHLRIAVFVLAAAVLYNVWAFFKPSARAIPVANRAAAQPLLQPEVAASSGARAIDPASIPAPPDIDLGKAPSSTRDPFLFGDENRSNVVRAQDDRTPDPVVRSILYSATRQSALIGNRMVGVGDSVGFLKIVSIERDAVVFATPSGDRRRVAMFRATSSGITR